MKFYYKAFQPDNRIMEGEVDVGSPDEVLHFLARKGLRPITVKPVMSGLVEKSNKGLGQRITITDKIFLTKYLSLMLKVGTDLFKVIDILIADFDKPSMKVFLKEVRNDLEKGKPFYSSFERHPRYFSDVFVNLIKAGEASGNLGKVFDDLSVSLEKERELKSKIKGALIYPILLLGLAGAILTFLVTFALPKIASVFDGGGIEPPLFSKIVFGVGLFLEQYILIFLTLGVVILIIFGFFLFRTNPGRRLLIKILNAIPFVKPVTSKLALQRFTGTLSSLLKSGMSIIDSLEITASAVGNGEIAESLRRIARQGIAKGLTIGGAFKKESVFPNVVSNLIAVSEKAGHLDEILRTLSEFYEIEIDRSLKTLVSFLEPALLIIIGAVVGVIALAIIVPIYQLVGQF